MSSLSRHFSLLEFGQRPLTLVGFCLLLVFGCGGSVEASCGHYVIWGEGTAAPIITRSGAAVGVGLMGQVGVADGDSSSWNATSWQAGVAAREKQLQRMQQLQRMGSISLPDSHRLPCSGPGCEQRESLPVVPPMTVITSSVELIAWFVPSEIFFDALVSGRLSDIKLLSSREFLARIERPPRS